MNKALRYISCAFALLAAVSCSGPDDGVTGSEEGLVISADKTEVMADGSDAVTFTVTFNGEDVSNAKTLQIIRIFEGEKKYMAYGANQFKTLTAGTYKFRAEYYYGGKHLSENEIEVEAKQFFTGEEKNYRRRFLATLFTSTGCSSCPTAAKGLKKLQEDNPGEITVAAYHHFMEGVSDPMEVQETYDLKTALGGFTGLPSMFWDMRKSSKSGGLELASGFDDEKKAFSTYSGVRINSTYDQASSKLDIELGITSNVKVSFRYVVVLVEDGISSKTGAAYEQFGTAEGTEYIHNNVVRKVLTATLGNDMNDKLPFTVGVEVKASESVTLSGAWEVENMRVIVAALTQDDGSTWTVNNVSECKAGGSVPYLYAE